MGAFSGPRAEGLRLHACPELEVSTLASPLTGAPLSQFYSLTREALAVKTPTPKVTGYLLYVTVHSTICIKTIWNMLRCYWTSYMIFCNLLTVLQDIRSDGTCNPVAHVQKYGERPQDSIQANLPSDTRRGAHRFHIGPTPKRTRQI